MNSSSQKHISLVASVLKPQDDHRVTEKWACFFEKELNHETHVFARKSENRKLYPNINFHDSFSYKNRLLSCFVFYTKLRKIKPDAVIITSFELLIPAFIHSLFSKTTYYYDVMENYRLNILKQGNYKKLKKSIYTLIIRLSENISLKYIKHYFYTEEIYKKQLPFLNKRSTLIKNYYSYPFDIKQNKKESKPLIFLITGTISEAYGTSKGIQWFNEILIKHPDSILKIIGHKTTNYKLPKINSNNAIINLSEKPIQHLQVLKEIKQADYLLLPYIWNESFNNCTPVKLLEANQLKTKTIVSKNDFLHPFTETGLTTFITDSKELKLTTETEINRAKLEKSSPKFEIYYETLKNIFT